TWFVSCRTSVVARRSASTASASPRAGPMLISTGSPDSWLGSAAITAMPESLVNSVETGTRGARRRMIYALLLSSLAGGGAERAMLRLAVAFQRRGHAVRLIVLNATIEHEVPPELELHMLRTRKGVLGTWLAGRAIRALYRRLGLGSECVTVSTLPFADRVAVSAGLPNVWCRITNNLSAEIADLRRKSPGKAARRLARYRRLYEGRNLIAVSEGVAADLESGIGLQRARIVRIYNGFDLEAIRAAAARPEPDLPGEPLAL